MYNACYFATRSVHLAGPDAYQVLDVPATATVPEVRKKFWRISLLVHPDKCRHEGAATAFDAVKKAAEILMDATSRNDLDERKRKQAEADLDQQVAAELEKDRLWRVAQGTATAEDLKYAFCAAMQSNKHDALFDVTSGCFVRRSGKQACPHRENL